MSTEAAPVTAVAVSPTELVHEMELALERRHRVDARCYQLLNRLYGRLDGTAGLADAMKRANVSPQVAINESHAIRETLVARDEANREFERRIAAIAGTAAVARSRRRVAGEFYLMLAGEFFDIAQLGVVEAKRQGKIAGDCPDPITEAYVFTELGDERILFTPAPLRLSDGSIQLVIGDDGRYHNVAGHATVRVR